MHTSALKKLHICQNQLDFFKYQSDLFFKALASSNVTIKKSRQLNLFAKMFGYKSYAELNIAASGNGRATKDNIYLAGANNEPGILSRVYHIEDLKRYMPQVTEALQALHSLPAEGFDLLEPDVEGNFCLVRIDMFSALSSCIWELDEDDWIDDQVEFSTVAAELFSYLESVYGAKSALLFTSEDLALYADEHIPEVFDYSVSGKLKELALTDKIEWATPSDSISEQYHFCGDISEARLATSIKSLFLVVQTHEPIDSSADQHYLPRDLHNTLENWLVTKSGYSFLDNPLFATIEATSLVKWEEDMEDATREERIHSANEFVVQELNCMVDWIDDPECPEPYMIREINRFLGKNPDLTINCPLFVNLDTPIAYLYASSDNTKLLIPEFDVFGLNAGFASSVLHGEELEPLLENVEVYFTSDFLGAHPGELPEGLLPRECFSEIIERASVVADEFPANLAPALENCYRVKSLKGFDEGYDKFPWKGRERQLKTAGVESVVVEILCEIEGDRECFVIASFLNDRDALVAQCSISIATTGTSKCESLYRELEQLERHFSVSKIRHIIDHPDFFVEDAKTYSYKKSTAAKMSDRGLIVAKITLEKSLDSRHLSSILDQKSIVGRVTRLGPPFALEDGTIGISMYPNLIPETPGYDIMGIVRALYDTAPETGVKILSEHFDHGVAENYLIAFVVRRPGITQSGLHEIFSFYQGYLGEETYSEKIGAIFSKAEKEVGGESENTHSGYSQKRRLADFLDLIPELKQLNVSGLQMLSEVGAKSLQAARDLDTVE